MLKERILCSGSRGAFEYRESGGCIADAAETTVAHPI
jgi:hypothetical protein